MLVVHCLAVGELKEDHVVSIPDIAQQFSDKAVSILVSCGGGGGGGMTREAFLERCFCLIKGRDVETYYFLFLKCYELLVLRISADDGLSNDSGESEVTLSVLGELLQSMRVDLDTCVHQNAYLFAAGLDCDGLRNQLHDHVGIVYDAMSATLSQPAILSSDDVTTFFDNVRRVESYYAEASELSSVDCFAQLDQSFVAYLQKDFSDLPLMLFVSDHNDTFCVLASKLQLLRYNSAGQSLLPLSLAYFSALRGDVKMRASEQLQRIKEAAGTAMETESFGDIEGMLHNLNIGEFQLGKLLPDFDSVQRILMDLHNSVKQIVEDLSSAVLSQLCPPPFSSSTYADIVQASGGNRDPSDGLLDELEEYLHMCKVIDQHGHYNHAWDGQLSFQEEFPRLVPHLEASLEAIQAKRLEYENRVMRDPDHCLVKKVESLLQLVWFDAMSTHQSTVSLTVQCSLNIARECCQCRLGGLQKECLSSLSADQFEHKIILEQLSELYEFRALCGPLSLPLDMTPVLAHFQHRIENYGNSVSTVCIDIADIASCVQGDGFPFEVTHEFMTYKSAYEEVAKEFNLGTELHSVLSSTENAISQCLQKLILDPLCSPVVCPSPPQILTSKKDHKIKKDHKVDEDEFDSLLAEFTDADVAAEHGNGSSSSSSSSSNSSSKKNKNKNKNKKNKKKSTTAAAPSSVASAVVEVQPQQEPDVLCVDASLLSAILEWEDQMLVRAQSLLPFVQKLASYDVDAAGNSLTLRGALKASLVKLMSNIQRLILEANDFVLLESNISLLEKYIPLNVFVDENLSTQHSFFFGQLVTMQSNVQEEYKEKIKTFDFSSMREYLDKCNDKENPAVYKRYTELMTLIKTLLSHFVKDLEYSDKDGVSVAEGFAKLDHIWTQVGGHGNKYDHIQQFCGIDVEGETNDLRTRMNAYIDEQLLCLKEYKGQHLETAIKAANTMWVYHGHLQLHVASSRLQKELANFAQHKLAAYLCWNGTDEPAPGSLGYQVLTLVYACSAQQSKDKGEGAISVAELDNVLDQLEHLQGLYATLHPTLQQCIDYSFWSRQVMGQFDNMFNQISSAASVNGTCATALSILNLVDTNFSKNFMRHMQGDGFQLKARIVAMKVELEEYNRSRVSAFETEEGCQRLKIRLDNLKKEYGSYSGYARRSYAYAASLIGSSTQVCSEYTAQQKYYQKFVNKLVSDLDQGLDDNNQDLVQSKIFGLQMANNILYMHLNVPWHEIDKGFSTHFKDLLKNLMIALEAKDMPIFEQRFEVFYFYRKLLSGNGLPTDKACVDGTADMHVKLATIIDTCRTDFEDMCVNFNFDDAINLGEMIKAGRHFIDAPNTQDYCKRFQEVMYMTGDVNTKKSLSMAKYTRSSSMCTDHGLHKLSGAMSKFPQLTEISNAVQKLHTSILNKVKESVEHHEYFKLKDISEGLRSFHLLNDLGGNCKDVIDGTKQAVHDIMKGHMDALRDDVNKHWTNKAWTELNASIQLLENAEEELKHISGLIDTTLMYSIRQDLEGKLSAIGNRAIDTATNSSGDQKERVNDFALQLSELGRVYDQVQMFHIPTKTEIQRVLNHCREKCGLPFIFQLGISLNEGAVFGDEENAVRIGRRLVTDFNHFKDVATMAWNNSVCQLPVDESLKNMECYTYDTTTKQKNAHPFDDAILKAMFEQYKVKYEELVGQYLPVEKDITEIVTAVLAQSAAMQPCTLATWGDSMKKEIPHLLAGIFAYYTVSKCGDSFNIIGDGDEGEYSDDDDEEGAKTVNAQDILITPHNIQVLTILRLLGCADSSVSSLKNHLMQIGTGEGKSIVLGALATIFGILNFSVRCVCYSEYLSARDYSDFKDIFEAFNCQHRIVYSKITAFSEDSVAKRGNIRELTRRMIMGKSDSADKQKGQEMNNDDVDRNLDDNEGRSCNNHLEEVLLVDEVDVFFGKDFYGQTYNQVTHISTSEVTALIKKIWKERASKPSLRSLSSCPEYQKLLADFPQWKFLIDNELKLMCSQVNSFDKPAYHYNSQTDQIGYTDHDTISYSLTYGYRTLFAYMGEMDKGNVKATHKGSFEQKHLHMQVSCGQFSYANINPACILGVSGTLKALTDYEQEVMARYRIEQYSIAPSVYGSKDLVFDAPDTGVCIANDKANYFKAIVDVINDISRTKDSSRKKHRAVIVFFESFERMEEFRTSEFFRQVIEKDKVNRLSENTAKDARDYIITKAANVGQVTLSTKVFGRGTDFISRDAQLNERGGTHIVQTFLSDMLTEEIQIQGRTSRQGQKGSYSLVLMMEDALVEGRDTGKGKQMVPRNDTLAYFDIKLSEMNDQSRADRYRYLCQKRTEKRATESIQIEENLVVASARDITTRAYFDALLAKQMVQSSALFEEIYLAFKGAAGSQQVGLHVIFMLDESGSMNGGPFDELRGAYNAFVAQRLQHGGDGEDVLTVINFASSARTVITKVPFASAPALTYQGGGTAFCPPLEHADAVLKQSAGADLMPILIFMTDGGCGDIGNAVAKMTSIDTEYKDDSLQTHFVAFGQGANMGSLHSLVQVCTDGHIHTAAMGDLSTTFKQIEQSLVIAEYN